MERAELKGLLEAGPSRRFNVLDVTRRLLAQGRRDELLFKTGFLNQTIILKYLDHRCHERRNSPNPRHRRPFQMLIYLPYDPLYPTNGGEAVIYSHEALCQLYANRTNMVFTNSDGYEADAAILDVLDELPALNPFLLRDGFDRTSRAVPGAYLEVEADVAERLEARLRGRIRPLVLAAFGHDDQRLPDALDFLVEAFLRPEKNANLRHLGGALRLDAAAAPEILGAWTGIAYFEDELARLKPDLQRFAAWLMNDARPRDYMDVAEGVMVASKLAQLRQAVRDGWRTVRGILDDYEATYQALVLEDDPKPFVEFLKRCRQEYWRMGDLFGRFEQSLYGWRRFAVKFRNGPMPNPVFGELLEFLAQTHDINGHLEIG